MRLKYGNSVLALMLAAVLMLILTAGAGFEPFRMQGGGYANPALAYLMAAPASFYGIYGRWPISWSEVRQSGLVQVELRNSDGMVVDPDDGSFDFVGDVRYSYSPGSAAPQILLNEDTRIDLLPQEMNYERLFDSLGVSTAPAVQDIYQTDELQVLLGMQEMAMQAVSMFTSVNGRAPYAWTEVEQSGLAPFRCGDLNPATGSILKMDGSALDLAFAYHPGFGASNVRAMRAPNEPLWEGSAL